MLVFYHKANNKITKSVKNCPWLLEVIGAHVWKKFYLVVQSDALNYVKILNSCGLFCIESDLKSALSLTFRNGESIPLIYLPS